MTNHKWLFWILNLIWFQNNFQGVFWYLPFFFAVARYSSSFRSRWGHRILVCRSPRGENCSEEIKRSRIKSVCYHLETSTREKDLRLPWSAPSTISAARLPLSTKIYSNSTPQFITRPEAIYGHKVRAGTLEYLRQLQKDSRHPQRMREEESLAGKCICLQLLK